ncbi:hypothetical protein Vretimale_9424, partial [Volvox reticuliferus]
EVTIADSLLPRKDAVACGTLGGGAAGDGAVIMAVAATAATGMTFDPGPCIPSRTPSSLASSRIQSPPLLPYAGAVTAASEGRPTGTCVLAFDLTAPPSGETSLELRRSGCNRNTGCPRRCSRLVSPCQRSYPCSSRAARTCESEACRIKVYGTRGNVGSSTSARSPPLPSPLPLTLRRSCSCAVAPAPSDCELGSRRGRLGTPYCVRGRDSCCWCWCCFGCSQSIARAGELAVRRMGPKGPAVDVRHSNG